jgi:hypothetical protein
MDKEQLQKAMVAGYQVTCAYFKIIPTRKVVFKGFYNQEIYQEILNNREIMANLELNTPQLKKYFGERLQSLILTKAGMALPAKWEVWIIINPFYLKFASSEKWAVDFIETVAHEIAHAVTFNWDVHWAHANPHAEITKYLKDYLEKNHDWKNILKGIEN